MVGRLARGGHRLNFCYEAGPCGYGLHRLFADLGHDCVVVAPSLIPMKAGDRVKTDRRDALMLAKLHRAGELTPIWIPDAAHEAMRDLVRARATAVRVLSKARQHLQGFLLRHGIYHGARAWTLAYRRWLTTVRFDHPAQQIVLQDYIHAVEDAETRRRLTRQIEELMPKLVDGAGGRGAPGDARGRLDRRGHGGGRSRRLSRFANPRQLMAYLGLVPSEHSSGSSRPARRNHQGRQCPCASRTDRGRLDLSHVGPRQSETSRSPRATSAAIRDIAWKAQVRLCARYRRRRCGQAEGRGHHRDRPRDGRLHLGDRRGFAQPAIGNRRTQIEQLGETAHKRTRISRRHGWRQDTGGEPSRLL